MNPLEFINQIKDMYNDQDPRSMAQGSRNMYADGQLVTPSVDGARPGYRGDKTQEVLKAYKEYKKSHYRSRHKYPIIPFTKFFEMYAKENFADGGSAGQLVTPSVDGSRPGYSGVYKRQEKPGHAVKWRIRGERGGVKAADWLKERGYETTFTSKAEAEKVNKLFNEAVTETKGDISKANWMKEGKELAEEFNAKVLKDFANKNMSNTPAWKKFLEGKKLKHAGADHYKSQRVVVGAMDSGAKKYELADVLIDDATKTLKHTDWMEIQKKLTKSPVINTKSFRKHIDKHNKLNDPSIKASQAFDYLLNNNVSMEIPKNLPLSLQGDRGNLLRKVIYDLTGVGTRPIVEGLNSNKNYKKYKKLVQFADRSKLWNEAAGKTLKEIMEVADYRVGGNVSWSYGSTKKIAKDANGFIFEWGKRHWNYHMKNKTGDSKIKFYWKNKFDANGNPLEIDWEKVPKNKNSVKSIKPTEVFFRYKNSETGRWGKNNWSMSSLRTDGLKSGLFNEVYDAKNAYDDLLAKPVTNPFNPEGNKIRFGQLMKKTFKEGFEDLSISPYSHEHAAKGVKYSGVNELPFNNIKIATSRVNGALNALRSMEGKTINKNVTKMILNELGKNVFDPYSKTFVDDISTAGQKLATGVAEGTIYEPKKTELNIVGEKIIKESKDFTKLPSKTKEGLLHVAGIDWTKPEGRLALKTLTTAQTLNKFLLSKGHKICRGQLVKAAGGGRIGFKGMCGAEFAKNFPEEFINRIGNYPDAAKAVNRANPAVMKKFLNAVAKDTANPFGWIGGDLIFSTMYSGVAEAEGKTPLEALDEGLLWFLPEGVIDAKKKALFGYEGTPSGAYKMEGHAGMYDKDQIADMSAYLDIEKADRKWDENMQELAALNTKINTNPELFGQVTSQQIENSRNRLQSNIDEASIAGNTLIKDVYTRNTGLRFEDGKPFKKELSDEEFGNLYQQTQKNLWDVQKRYAMEQINRAKQGDLNLLYAKKDDPEAQLPLGMGDTGRIWTSLTSPIDMYRASSPMKASERLPAGIKQGYQKILDLWNMGLVPQEEKEKYAKEMGRYDLLHKEHAHPLYGPALSYQQYQRVFPEYFGLASGGRAGYMGGGIAAIRKPHAIPPKRQGVRSIMINVNED